MCGLTHTQRWRMQKQRTNEHSAQSMIIASSNSCDNLTQTKTGVEDSSINTIPLKQKKSVHFHTTVKVVLIPDRREFEEHNLIQELWWTGSDYKSFKSELSRSVHEYMVQISCPHMKTAYKLYIANCTA